MASLLDQNEETTMRLNASHLQEGNEPLSISTKEKQSLQESTKCCICSCHPLLIKYNPLPEHPTRLQRLRYAFLCPIRGYAANILTICLSACLIFGGIWGITGSAALPGGNLFALLVLGVSSSVAGLIVQKIRLPPLLGMLIAGFLLRNVPGISIAEDIQTSWSAALRNIALTVILTRAGLGLDPVALRKLSFGVVRLAFLPCLVEAATVAIASHFLLGFPWEWGFLLGFVLAAVSPAVVVPSLLSLQARGYGADKGISTLIIAASSIDDIIAITGFGIVLSIAFSSGSLWWTIMKGPFEAVIGVLYGVVLGLVLWFIPDKDHPKKMAFRFILLMMAGLLSAFGSRQVHIDGAGPLGVLTLAFVVNLRWRKDRAPNGEAMVSTYFGYLWIVFQPLLFGLIGAEVSLALIQPATIGLGLAVLAIGLVLRIIASFCAVFGLGLTLREQLFVPLAWLPKATVQAAIGSIALDTARSKGAPEDQIALGIQLLTVAVLAIIVTAPAGAIAISLSGPVLLEKSAADVETAPPRSIRVHDADDAGFATSHT